MYKNLQYLQSPWVHRQSAITGNTAPSLPAAELHRKSALLLYWAYTSHTGILGQVYSCWVIVKLCLATRHIMNLTALCSLWFWHNQLQSSPPSPCNQPHDLLWIDIFFIAWLRVQKIHWHLTQKQTHIRDDANKYTPPFSAPSNSRK